MNRPFTATPIRQDFLTKVRETGLDDQSQPVVHLIAQGGEPCRDALRRARPGEALILASYCPFSLPGPYREYGAVFVRQAADGEGEHPWSTDNQGDYLSANKPVVLRAYNAQERISAATLVMPDQIDAGLEDYFAREETRFVLLRFPAYGCYALRIDPPYSA